jgi:hypothetical protein
VPNLFIDQANIGDKKSWQASFGFENNNKMLVELPFL